MREGATVKDTVQFLLWHNGIGSVSGFLFCFAMAATRSIWKFLRPGIESKQQLRPDPLTTSDLLTHCAGLGIHCSWTQPTAPQWEVHWQHLCSPGTQVRSPA